MSRLQAGQSNIVGMGALGQALRPLIPGDAPVVFFCVKAFDLRSALEEHAAAWPEGYPFVVLSNGYVGPVIDSCRDLLGARLVRLGMTTIGATIRADGELAVFGAGAVTMWGGDGSDVTRTPTSAERQLIDSHRGWAWSEDIRPMLRRKWIFNTTLNTLCGVLRLSSNGKLVNHRGLAETILAEAYDLSIELWPDLPMSESLPILAKDLWQLVERTKDNENSMARDVRLDRRNESDFLAGLALGRRGFDKLKTYHTQLARYGTAK